MVRFMLCAGAIALSLVLGGCGGGGSSTSDTQTQTGQNTAENGSATQQDADTASQTDSGALIASGQQTANARGCLACHSIDGGQSMGPSWLNLYGASRTLTDGSTVTADEAYLRESIADRSAKIVEGYGNLMPAFSLSDDELAALIAYIQSLKE